MSAKSEKAFTLIEIMVALAIIAITMGAIIENTTASTRNAQYLQDKTIASWVALNQIALVRARRQWSNASNKKGSVEMANQQWIWKMQIVKTSDINLRRLNIEVYSEDDDDQPLATMTSFLGRL